MFAHLVNFHWGTFAVLDAALFRAFFAERRHAKVPDFIVDLAKRVFGEFVGWRKIFLKARHALQGAINLLARESAQNPMHVLDLGDTMANHGEIISSGDGQA